MESSRLYKALRISSCMTAISILYFLTPTGVIAGGYLAVDTEGTPYKWTAPIVVNLDLGPLGKLTKAQADELALDAMSHWTSSNVPGSTIQFVRGPDLSEDNGDGLGTDPENEFDDDENAPTDGLTAIIYDQTGAILESVYGNLQANAIVGGAGPVVPKARTPAPLVEGGAIINGRFYDDAPDEIFKNDLPYDQFKGAFIHEIGHMLNFDHAQAGVAYSETGFEIGSMGGYSPPRYEPDYRGVPTMFPFVMPQMETLELDDKSWLLEVYGDSASKAGLGSISGIVSTFDGITTNGINIVAYNVDDPTSMVTCVSGYIDPYHTLAATGSYKIPLLPPGKWVLYAESILGAFIDGSSVGPEDVDENNRPAKMQGPPEFLNEPDFESTNDPSSVSTTFEVTASGPDQHITGVNLQMNDLNDLNGVLEVDAGASVNQAQVLEVEPGKFTYVSGTANTNEPVVHNEIYHGDFIDFYKVEAPAGVRLDQMFIISSPDIVDLYLFERDSNGNLQLINGTVSALGAFAVDFMLDSSRIGESAYSGQYYFGVGFPIPLLGGSSNPVTSDYTFGIMYSVSDRDAVLVSGLEAGELVPESTMVRVKGRGFKNTGSIAPTITFSTPDVNVNSVTFIDSNTLDVSISTAPTLQPGSHFTLQVTNSQQSGGYAGRKRERVAGSQTRVFDWGIY